MKIVESLLKTNIMGCFKKARESSNSTFNVN